MERPGLCQRENKVDFDENMFDNRQESQQDRQMSFIRITAI